MSKPQARDKSRATSGDSPHYLIARLYWRHAGRIPGMVKKLSLATMLVAFAFAAAESSLAASQTMRLDYYHSGNASQELFSVDRVVVEPLPWPGNPQKAIDDTNL